MRPLNQASQARGKVKTTRSAFTLVELLVVVAVIGLLIAILFPTLTKVGETARIASCKTLLRGIEGALTAYQGDEGRYPEDEISNWGAVSGYPADPSATQSFIYTLMHGRTVYFNAKDEELVDSTANGTIDRSDPKIGVKDPWWDAASPNEHVILYIVAPHSKGRSDYFNFPGGRVGLYNLWGPGPDGKCDSCATSAGFLKWHVDGGASTSTAYGGDHLGGDTDPKDDIQ